MIFLIGYMGVGKSMIAKELGTNLNIPIIDTDIEIEKSEKNSINNLFNSIFKLINISIFIYLINFTI